MNMPPWPKVSILTPAYNMAKYLPEALDSALNQDYPDLEIIVVDDGSTDATREVAESYLPRVKYFYQSNQGVACALNSAMELAQGDFVRFLAADDALVPGSIEEQVRVMLENPDVGLLFGQHYVMDKDGKLMPGVSRPFPSREPLTIIPSQRAFRWMLKRCRIGCATVLLRKSLWDRLGPYDPKSVPGEDWDMYLRVSASSNFAYLAKPLAYYRVHGESITAGYRIDKFKASHLHTLGALFAREQFPYRRLRGLAYAYLDRQIARHGAYLRNPGAFAGYFLKSVAMRPQLLAEQETWGTLLDGAKLLLPASVIEAVRRSKRSIRLRGAGSQTSTAGRG